MIYRLSKIEAAELSVIKFIYDVPLEHTMVFEPVYHQASQLSLSEKQKMWNVKGSLFVWMFADGQLAGECYGFPLATSGELSEVFSKLPDAEKKNAIHCYSNTILPSFQKQGLGTILKAHWLGLAAGKGFEVVYGHARPGGSASLNAKLGAVFLADLPDWCGTGEKYKRYRLALQ